MHPYRSEEGIPAATKSEAMYTRIEPNMKKKEKNV